ncbi:sulfoxide reductase heme-binding subunit YedZ [Rhodoferax lacus]|uniref:Protein-methionine-sulfoxide reductase heme-binding subunit MsrQ n=1 Tax=Rhodoferax lacus TaxID=2184758 RepID=A0A3E1REW6_9BURK|nr:protein-methionine-sulfoxide reductase heme-binding subunit MsrQ [Rhodoferax lacus]RFO97916.1 sulfoxide reductase heme-binding subunit YedZ [Rhodoferax lacus]
MRSAVNRCLSSGWAKPAWFVLSCLPAAWLVFAALGDQLGANPAEALVRSTGDWTLRALCLVLAITPVRTVLGIAALARLRRMAGLFVYFYAVLHLLAYSWFDMGFDVADIAKDIVKRPFILVGFSAFVLLTPLALTSFNRAIKALGAKRWQTLHKLVYAVAGLAVLHFFWMRAGKNNFAEVAAYALILAVLLGWRAYRRWHLSWRSYLGAVPTGGAGR